MKVRVTISKEIEVDINSPALEKLDARYRVTPVSNWGEIDNALVEQGIEDIEKALGIPFGNDFVSETIVSVCAMDGEPIIETWLSQGFVPNKSHPTRFYTSFLSLSLAKPLPFGVGVLSAHLRPPMSRIQNIIQLPQFLRRFLCIFTKKYFSQNP